MKLDCFNLSSSGRSGLEQVIIENVAFARQFFNLLLVNFGQLDGDVSVSLERSCLAFQVVTFFVQFNSVAFRFLKLKVNFLIGIN